MTNYALIKRSAEDLDVSTYPKIARAARVLLNLAGLHDWTFEWSNAKRQLGVCYHSHQQIKLSKYLVKRLNSADREAQVVDTILHEIAHALTPGAKHGYQWRKVARALGCSADRCYDYKELVDDTKVDYNWRIECANPKCSATWEYHRLNRRIKRQLEESLRRCPRCKNSKFLIFDLRTT